MIEVIVEGMAFDLETKPVTWEHALSYTLVTRDFDMLPRESCAVINFSRRAHLKILFLPYHAKPCHLESMNGPNKKAFIGCWLGMELLCLSDDGLSTGIKHVTYYMRASCDEIVAG